MGRTERGILEILSERKTIDPEERMFRRKDKLKQRCPGGGHYECVAEMGLKKKMRIDLAKGK